MKQLIAFLVIGLMVGVASAESYLYLSQEKVINGSFLYRMPKLEWNYYKNTGKIFGTSCYYLSEFEGSLNYTAPRSSMFRLNHHSIQGEWNLGVQIGPTFMSYSLGGIYYIEGNDDKIPSGMEMLNTAKVGIVF